MRDFDRDHTQHLERQPQRSIFDLRAREGAKRGANFKVDLAHLTWYLRPRYIFTWVPRYLGTWAPVYLDTWIPWCLGT